MNTVSGKRVSRLHIATVVRSDFTWHRPMPSISSVGKVGMPLFPIVRTFVRQQRQQPKKDRSNGQQQLPGKFEHEVQKFQEIHDGFFRKELMGLFTASINAAEATWRNVIGYTGRIAAAPFEAISE